MEITFDELIERTREVESTIHESVETENMLKRAALALSDAAATSGKITVLTDYDADGLTSAYIVQKAVETLNPNCEVNVEPNDRRGAYGLNESSLDRKDFGDSLIVLDMGSNQIPALEEHYGKGALVIDHHLVGDAELRKKIIDTDNYCNPHVINENDKDNAQYCTAGLAYRLYELSGCKELADEKQNNTVLAMAAIGTAADVVNVIDTNSYNRNILKEGVKVIDNAEPSNFDYVIGNILSEVEISETTTAHQIAFNAGAFLNSASRMSSLLGENGAARTYKALIAPDDKASTYREIDALQSINRTRKDMINRIQLTEDYQKQLTEEKFGENRENNIAIVTLPADTPHSFAGLVAGKFADAADKAVICLVQNSETGNWSGSGRNVASNETSLIEFMQQALNGKDIDVKYGGHSNALGISSLKDVEGFTSAILESKDLMVRKENVDNLTVNISGLNAEELLKKMKELEPIGEGLKVPNTVLEGKKMATRSVSGNKSWQKFSMKMPDGSKFEIADWHYDDKTYLPAKDNAKYVKLNIGLEIGHFKGEHVDFSVKFDRGEYLERAKELNIPPFHAEQDSFDTPETPENKPVSPTLE